MIPLNECGHSLPGGCKTTRALFHYCKTVAQSEHPEGRRRRIYQPFLSRQTPSALPDQPRLSLCLPELEKPHIQTAVAQRPARAVQPSEPYCVPRRCR